MALEVSDEMYKKLYDLFQQAMEGVANHIPELGEKNSRGIQLRARMEEYVKFVKGGGEWDTFFQFSVLPFHADSLGGTIGTFLVNIIE